jgi:protein transport protein HofB
MTGHLVLSTLHCGRAQEARPRLLEMGVPEYAVDLGLVGVIAQRLMRRSCRQCRGNGCSVCLESGYRGRMVVSEVLDDPAAEPSPSIRAIAHRRVEGGATDDAEVQRVLGGVA